jgi:AcrR family transcriptional regulator
MDDVAPASKSSRSAVLGRKDIRTFSRRQALINERRMQIIKGTTKLFVKQGYDQTSMREVERASNMSSGNLYHYVGSKADILDLIITYATSQQAELIENFSATLDSVSPTEALNKLFRKLCRWHDRDQDVTLFIYQETKNLPRSSRQRIFDSEYRIMAAFERVLQRGVETGEFKVNAPKLIAHNMVFLAHGWALRRWFLKKYWNLGQYIALQTENIFRVIGADTKPAGTGAGNSIKPGRVGQHRRKRPKAAG